MDGVNVNVNVTVQANNTVAQPKPAINETAIQVEQNVSVQTGYTGDGYSNVQADVKVGKVPTNISFIPEETPPAPEAKSTPPLGIAKNMATGVLIGGGATALATTLAKSAMNDAWTRPSTLTVGVGVGLGAGIALLKINSSDKNVNNAKNAAGGALLGAGAAGIATGIAKSLFVSTPTATSATTLLLGGAIGGGIALSKADVGDNKGLKLARNVASTAMIAGGVTGLANGLGRTLSNEALLAGKNSNIALGAAIAGGVALAKSDVDSPALRMVKNATAGVMIAGGATAMATRNPVAVGIASAIGAGIGVASSK